MSVDGLCCDAARFGGTGVRFVGSVGRQCGAGDVEADVIADRSATTERTVVLPLTDASGRTAPHQMSSFYALRDPVHLAHANRIRAAAIASMAARALLKRALYKPRPVDRSRPLPSPPLFSIEPAFARNPTPLEAWARNDIIQP